MAFGGSSLSGFLLALLTQIAILLELAFRIALLLLERYLKTTGCS